MQVLITQFVRPNGRQKPLTGEVDDSCKSHYEALIAKGCRLTAEVLPTGHVHLCIEHPDHGDFDSSICANKPEATSSSLTTLLKRYTDTQFEWWLDQLKQEEEGASYG